MRRRSYMLSAKIALGAIRGRGRPDIFVTHAPPCGLGDRENPCHAGFEAFLPLIDRYEPPLWLHGHVHLYGPEVGSRRVTNRGTTRVVNVYGHQLLTVGGARGAAAAGVATMDKGL